MRHWAYTLDAARSIVRTKAEAVNNDKLAGYIMAACILVVLVSGIVDLFKQTKEPKDAAATIDLAQLPAGSIIVLPREKA